MIHRARLPQFCAEAVASLKYQDPIHSLYASSTLDEVRVASVDPMTIREAFRLNRELALDLLEAAVYVILPPNGEIYKSNNPADIDRARPDRIANDDECQSVMGLPAPITAFEFRATHPVARNPRMYSWCESGGHYAPKRIVIAVAHRQVFPDADIANQFMLFGLRECPLTTLNGRPFWEVNRFAAQFPIPLVFEQGDDGGWSTGCTPALTDGNAIKDEHHQACGEAIVHMYTHQLGAVVQACHALRAGAELIETVDSDHTQRQRLKKRGAGGFTYHVLKVAGQTLKAGPSMGSHTSPRRHIRRAHIRKLPTGKLTLVRQCLVGSRGFVDKSYRIENEQGAIA